MEPRAIYLAIFGALLHLGKKDAQPFFGLKDSAFFFLFPPGTRRSRSHRANREKFWL
jgi:hypothetical protein